jgi:uncharacterized protein YndB with AHSA1/START domain
MTPPSVIHDTFIHERTYPVPAARVFAADGVRSSVSVATIELVPAADGTTLTWTEQGACLNGFDGAEAPRLRAGGTAEMLDGLARYLS